MAFSRSITSRTVFGDKVVVIGTYNCDSVTTGELETGLSRCDACFLTPTGAAVDANEASINETFPLAGGTLTLITDSGATGQFMAIGA